MEAVDGSELKHIDTVLHNSLKRMGWRLKAPARRRIALDVAALSTGLRVVVMVDYAGAMPRLQQQLCMLLALLAEESRPVTSLRVMSMEDIAYLIHLDSLHLYMEETLNRIVSLKFVVLDDNIARLALPMEEEEALRHFTCFQKHLISILTNDTPDLGETNIPDEAGYAKAELPNLVHDGCFDMSSQGASSGEVSAASQQRGFHKPPQSTWLVDLGGFLGDCQVALPTLNGWLLGYPIVYLLKKENIYKAVRTLSVSSLHLYKLLIQSDLTTVSSLQGKNINTRKNSMHELMSFTVPNELSSQGVREPWVETFLAYMTNKIKNSQLWEALELELTLQTCQAVAL